MVGLLVPLWAVADLFWDDEAAFDQLGLYIVESPFVRVCGLYIGDGLVDFYSSLLVGFTAVEQDNRGILLAVRGGKDYGLEWRDD